MKNFLYKSRLYETGILNKPDESVLGYNAM